jgi:hypothetical protein
MDLPARDMRGDFDSGTAHASWLQPSAQPLCELICNSAR